MKGLFELHKPIAQIILQYVSTQTYMVLRQVFHGLDQTSYMFNLQRVGEYFPDKELFRLLVKDGHVIYPHLFSEQEHGDVRLPFLLPKRRADLSPWFRRKLNNRHPEFAEHIKSMSERLPELTALYNAIAASHLPIDLQDTANAVFFSINDNIRVVIELWCFLSPFERSRLSMCI